MPEATKLRDKIQAAVPLMNRLEEIEVLLQGSKSMYFLSGTAMQPSITGRALLFLCFGAFIGFFLGLAAFEFTDSTTVLLLVIIAAAIAGMIVGILLAIGDKKRADQMGEELRRRIESLEMERSDILHSRIIEDLPEEYRKLHTFQAAAASLRSDRDET